MELRVAFTAREYERLVRFYCDGLGLETTQVWPGDQGRAVILDMGQATLEIFDEKQANTIDQLEAGKRLSGQIRLALKVPDLKAASDHNKFGKSYRLSPSSTRSGHTRSARRIGSSRPGSSSTVPSTTNGPGPAPSAAR